MADENINTGSTESTEPTGPTEPTSQEATDAQAPETQQYDPQQIEEWRKAYENREAWQRANTQRAQEIAQWQEFVRLMEQHPDLAEEFAQKLAERLGVPDATGIPPQGEESTAQPGDLARKISELEQKLNEIEQKELLAWADQQWRRAENEYQRLFGQPMPEQMKDRIKEHLAITGSIDPVASIYYVCKDQLLSRGAQASQEAAQKAQQAIQGAVTEGSAGGEQARQIDFSKMSLEELERLGRAAATGQADSDYNPFAGP